MSFDFSIASLSLGGATSFEESNTPMTSYGIQVKTDDRFHNSFYLFCSITIFFPLVDER